MAVAMNKPDISEILSPMPEAHPRIYAYGIASKSHAGLLKVGQTSREVKKRVDERLIIQNTSEDE